MPPLGQALADIQAMRLQMARGTAFRGYGPATVAATGILALGTAVAQHLWLAAPAAHFGAWLALWVGNAAVAASLIGTEAVLRTRRIHVGLADEMIAAAIGQVLPAIATGALLTIVLCQAASQSLWLLPGLWQILLGLGVFASCHRTLPAVFRAVGFWYICTGLAGIAWFGQAQAFSPWIMGAPFAGGQLLAALLLARNELAHARH